jgi:hypothetical protein
MRVKRVNRPNKRTFNVFNFIDDTSIPLPKALSSLYDPLSFSTNQSTKEINQTNWVELSILLANGLKDSIRAQGI